MRDLHGRRAGGHPVDSTGYPPDVASLRRVEATIPTAGASSGAGATRTSSPPTTRSSGRARRRASTSASSPPRSSAGRGSRTWSCRRRGSTPPASLARDLPQRPLRARRARLRQGLPRRRAGASAAASTTRPTWSPTPRDEARARGGARLVRGRRRRGDPLRRRHERGRRRRAARARRLRRRVTIDLRAAGPRARGRRRLARGAHPGGRHRARASRSSCASTA